MKRRSFLAMLGLAPLVPVAASAEVVDGPDSRPTMLSADGWGPMPDFPSSFDDAIRDMMRQQSAYFTATKSDEYVVDDWSEWETVDGPAW